MTSKLVKKTAKELAGAFYEGEDALRDGRYSRSTTFRSMGFTQDQFVNEYWPDFVVAARKILAHMLNDPGRHQSEKNQIFDALLAERGLMSDEDKVAPNVLRLN